MSAETFKAKAYIREGCPFSFRFWLFMVEAGLSDRIEIIRCDPEAPDFADLKKKLTAALGKPASFPTVEIAPGRYQSDSGELISHYAQQHGIERARLPLLTFYEQTIFPQLKELHEK